MPSIRQFAAAHAVSCFTVVASYDKLVARGYLESRRGAGFFVRERSPLNTGERSPTPSAGDAASAAQPKPLDVVWLIRNMFRPTPLLKTPGSGVLPAEWLDGAAIANALRSIGRQHANLLLNYGAPQGFLPLRQQLQLKLAELEIEAAPEQIVTTVGVTQALDLVAREFTRPGDTIFVDDPAWFLMFGSFAALGAKVVGIPRLADGPDLARLAQMAALHKPKLYVINSVLHNPSSTSLSAAKAFQVLRLAEEHGFTIVEDDIYCDLHPGSAVQPATRLAALDQLQRVIYLGGFSKSMAANLRVGFIATSPEWAQRLADRKMLATLTSSDIGERVAYKILSEGLYRKHLDRIRARLDAIRAQDGAPDGTGRPDGGPGAAGRHVRWVDAGRTPTCWPSGRWPRACCWRRAAVVASQLPSTRMRINVATMQEPAMWPFLAREINNYGEPLKSLG